MGNPAIWKPTDIHGSNPHRPLPTEFDLDHFLIAFGDATVSKFKKAECIFAQGDPADFIIYLRSGTAKLMVVSNRGKEATIGVIRAGEFLGEGCLAEQAARAQTAMAMTACSILRISKRSFSRLLREHTDFSQIFTRFLLNRWMSTQQELVNQRFDSSEFRLARVLLSMSTAPSADSDQRVLARMSQETLASMVGTTRSRISFFLNKFKKAGLIEYDGGIRINPGLERLVLGMAS